MSAPAPILAHGTSAKSLEKIAVTGILPRGGGRRNNWRHTVGSNKRAVYLSTAYAFYFAHVCSGDEDCAVIEVLPHKLNNSNLCADEDALEQSMRNDNREPAKLKAMSMKARTIYYRSRAHLYSAEDSLQVMGTCSHLGPIYKSALGRITIIPCNLVFGLVLKAHDPLISTLNFKFIGSQHITFQQWLFGELASIPQIKMTAAGYGVKHYPNLQSAVRAQGEVNA